MSLNLALSPTTLTVIPNKPAKPYYLDAIPIPAGQIKVDVRLLDPTGIDKINVYRDGALEGFVSIIAGQKEYTYTTATLTNNQTYSFKASCLTGTVESDFTAAVTAKADNASPTGNLNLTISLAD